MKRICMALDLKDDPKLIREYEKYHESVWPEVLESIQSSGIQDMQIYRTGTRLFMIMEVEENFDPQRKAEADKQNPAVQEWERLMDNFQQRLPWAKADQKWVPMDKIFQL